MSEYISRQEKRQHPTVRQRLDNGEVIADNTELGRVGIDNQLCNGCQLCIKACPASCLEMSGKHSVRMLGEYANCVACGDCVAICEPRALSVTRGMSYTGLYKHLGRGELALPRRAAGETPADADDERSQPAGECPPLAPSGALNAPLRDWTFLERYPDLAYVVKDDPKGYAALEAHYNRVLEFCETVVAPRALEVDRKMLEDPTYVPEDILKKACEYRLFSLGFPPIFGGPGGHFAGSFITYELIATHCVGIANLLGVSGLAIACVAATFDPRAIGQIADLICENEAKGIPMFLSTCVTEPGAGSDAEDPEEFAEARLSTVARRVDGGYVLNGTKVFISNGRLASLHVVVAYGDRRHRPEDLMILLVAAGSDGLSVPRDEKKMGQKVCSASEVVFEDVFVPEEMVCRLPDGPMQEYAQTGLANVLGLTRAGVGGFATGVAEGAYQTALKFVVENDFMGRPMQEHQWVRMELADLARRAQVARATYISALLAVSNVGLASASEDANRPVPKWMVENDTAKAVRRYVTSSTRVLRAFQEAGKEIDPQKRDIATSFGDVAKVSCSDLAMENCQKAISLMGKAGLRHENGAEKLLRDVKLLQIYEGTNQVNMLDFIKRRISRQFVAS